MDVHLSIGIIIGKKYKLFNCSLNTCYATIFMIDSNIMAFSTTNMSNINSYLNLQTQIYKYSMK